MDFETPQTGVSLGHKLTHYPATVGDGTERKAQARGSDITGLVNVIPGEHQGECRQVLLGFCFDRDKFRERLREIAYHAGIHCPETKLLVIVTSQWDPTEWKNHEKAFTDLNAKVVIFLSAFETRRKAR